MSSKTHYSLLAVDPSADSETIKKAFRREIARYHPDKVAHLGQEFQDMALIRAAELTTAYKTLTDLALREEYDASLSGGAAAPGSGTRPPAGDAAVQDSPRSDEPPPDPPLAARRTWFEQERAGRDDIMRRAVLARLREVVQQVSGDCEMRPIRGFDLACIPRAKPSLFRRSVPPVVLVSLVPLVNANVASEAWVNAVRARIEQKPVVVLLVGNDLAPPSELSRAIEESRRKNPGLQEVVFPVAVDARDWSAKIPANAPDAVRTIIDRLKNFVG